MEITQQLRDYAKQKGLETEEAVAVGLIEKRDEFVETGGDLYS